MTEFALPVLGLESPAPRTIAWKDGTVCGILNLAIDPVAQARYEAEQTRKLELRQHENVLLLEDYR
jgi:hypothetical protein